MLQRCLDSQKAPHILDLSAIKQSKQSHWFTEPEVIGTRERSRRIPDRLSSVQHKFSCPRVDVTPLPVSQVVLKFSRNEAQGIEEIDWHIIMLIVAPVHFIQDWSSAAVWMRCLKRIWWLTLNLLCLSKQRFTYQRHTIIFWRMS